MAFVDLYYKFFRKSPRANLMDDEQPIIYATGSKVEGDSINFNHNESGGEVEINILIARILCWPLK